MTSTLSCEATSVCRESRTGEILGATYRLMERIGSGGMAEVYAAEHVRLGRRFAVKVLLPLCSEKALRRFRDEAKSTARIDSEFVVNVVDCDKASDGAPYLVMELLRGEDLRSLIGRASPLPITRATKLILDACYGVAAAHASGIIHRDLKPENLFVTSHSTGEDWCKILDFGVAKMATSNVTADGAVIGTVRYMAPEQLRGESVTSSVDVYALGAILYECLCGEPAHTGTTPHELMFKIMNEAPTRIDVRQPTVPTELAAVIAKALEKQAEDRFATALEFAAAISPFARLGTGESSRPTDCTLELEPADVRLSTFPSPRYRVPRAVLGVALLLAGIGVSVGWKTPAVPRARIVDRDKAPVHIPDTPLLATTASLPDWSDAHDGRGGAPLAGSAAPTSAGSSASEMRCVPSPPRSKASTSTSSAGHSNWVSAFDEDNPYAR